MINKLSSQISISPLFEGKIIKIIKDFLGYSVFVKTPLNSVITLIWAVRHIIPPEKINTRRGLSLAQNVEHISIKYQTKEPPHLHILS